MRLATLIISLFLMLIAGVQSCAVAVGGGIAEDLSTAAKDKQDAQDIAGAGGLGIVAALMWLVAAAFVMSKPKVAMWIFGVASLAWLGAGAAGFSDAFIWMVASVILAVMAWRGIKEKAHKDEEDRARYQADVVTAAATLQHGQHAHAPSPQHPPAGWYSDSERPGERYWDGSKWTDHRRAGGEPPPPPQPAST
jgi:uncharacterized protein DUF2510